MLHLRVIVAPERAGELADALRTGDAVAHLVVLPGAARQPAGDVVPCDVAVEGAGRAARGTDAVVWDEVARRTGHETRLSATYLVLLTVATIIAAVGVLLDQPILVIGAMVVGPEFGPLAALSAGLVRRRPGVVGRSALALLAGFPTAMAVTVLTTWGLTALGLVDASMLVAQRPLTDFIWRPDALSWIVGLLAGVAGMLSLTSARSGALTGVLISVTTVPAAANAAVAIAYGEPREAAGSAAQLAINLTAIVTAGVLTLLAQRVPWRPTPRRAGEPAGVNPASVGSRSVYTQPDDRGGVMAEQPEPIEVQKYLAGMNYPAGKDDVVRHAREHGADGSALDALRAIPERDYDGPNAVSQEVARHS